MNYTKNHHLPQWEETDRIMRVDFNQMCANMETGLNKTASDAAASTAQAAQAAAAAQTTADSAVKKAETAQATANAAYSGSKLPYTVGSYTGTGTESQAVYLGFKPRFVIISAQLPTGFDVGPILFTILAGEGVMTSMLSFQATGFTVLAPNGQQPAMNQSNRLYTYIAFR